MRSCPHCGGEIRASVIKCVHCGMSLLELAQPDAAPARPGGSTPRTPSTSDTPPRPPGFMPGRPTASLPSVFEEPTSRVNGDPWVTPSLRADGHAPQPKPVEPEPKTGLRTTRRPDVRLMVAGGLALASAVAAYTTMALPWVSGRVVVSGQRSNTRLVADMTFRASASLAGPFAIGVAILTAVAGILWFWYGMDRWAHLPVFASPGLGMLAGVVGLGVLVTSKVAPSLWNGGFIANAHDAGLTRDAMRALLDHVPAPIVELTPQTGMIRFAAATGLAMLAAGVAWWSQRRRAA